MSFPFEETILKWDPEIELSNDFKMKDYADWSNPLARKKNPLPPLEKLPPLDDILNSVFPVRKFELNGKKYVQFVSAEEPERKVVKYELTAELQKKLKERQARRAGLSAVRLDLHFQLFDEIIRQVIINSPERGILLLRVRDDAKMTIAAYQSLYESSVLFGINKQIQAEEGKAELEKKIENLETQKLILSNRAIDLKNKLEATQKSYEEIRAYDKKRREDELAFLRKQSKHLEDFKTQSDGINS